MEGGGIGPIGFPMVADLTKEIARDVGVLSDDSVALRATFLIDRQGIVRHQIVNDPDLGRNVDDELRVLDALQHRKRTGEVCPANWEKGKKAMQPTPGRIKKYLKDFNLNL